MAAETLTALKAWHSPSWASADSLLAFIFTVTGLSGRREAVDIGVKWKSVILGAAGWWSVPADSLGVVIYPLQPWKRGGKADLGILDLQECGAG